MTRRIGRSCIVCSRRTDGASRCPQHTIPSHTDPEYRRNRPIALARDGYRCTICKRGAADGVRLEVDHILPLNQGGTHDLANLRVVCFEHNPRGG